MFLVALACHSQEVAQHFKGRHILGNYKRSVPTESTHKETEFKENIIARPFESFTTTLYVVVCREHKHSKIETIYEFIERLQRCLAVSKEPWVIPDIHSGAILKPSL
jgi:hypothetical protein